MAIADTITSMQTHTSNAYTMIGYGTDLTGINKNLENLSSTIFDAFLEALRTPDTLFTNLPKKSGSGSVITLNDTANAPMRIELGATELSQSGTPTPSSPQAVHTISGSNKVVVNGKNLFDKDSVEDGKEISNGTIYNNSSWCVSDYIVVEYNQTYIKNIGNGNDCIIYDKDKNKISTNDRRFTRNKITITEQNAKYIRVNLPLTSLDTYQLEKSNTATTYEPYISQEAEVDLSSKNLFNPYKVKAENGATLITTPTGFDITRTHGSGFGDEFIASYTIENLKANTIYTFNFDVETELNIGNGSIYVYSDRLFGTALTKSNYASSGNNHKWNITTSSNGKMVIGIYGTTSAQNKIIKLTNVQLEEGSTKTSFMEYFTYGEYCKIGNYEDKIFKNIPAFSEYDNTLEEGAWYIKKNIGKVVLDGTETITKTADTVTSNFSYALPQKSAVHDYSTTGKSNYFTPSYNNQVGKFYFSGSALNLILCMENTYTLETFKTWLSTNNVIVMYPIATPTYTQITGTLAEQLENVYQKLLSYSGTTNISQVNNDLSFNMSVLAIEE